MSFIRGFRPNGDLVDVQSRHSRDGWTHVQDHSSVYLDGKQYRHMREWRRPCVVCEGDVQVFEKVGAVDANSRFSNRTCKDHRGMLPAIEKGYLAWSKDLRGMVPGPSCVSSEPAAISTEELEELRMANKIMKEELSGLYARRNELIAEVEELKKLLAPENKMPWGS